MLCRPAAGLHAACAGVTRRIDPRRFVPCHEACCMPGRGSREAARLLDSSTLDSPPLPSLDSVTVDSLLRRPVHQPRSLDAELAFERRDIDVVARRDRTTRASWRSPRCSCGLPRSESARRKCFGPDPAQRRRHVGHRRCITGEIDFASVQLVGIREAARACTCRCRRRDHLQLQVRPHRRVDGVAVQKPRRREVLHEKHRAEDHI